MIIKIYEINKLNTKKYNAILLYGDNEGLKNQIINENLISTNKNNKVEKYDEVEILNNYEVILSSLLNKSFGRRKLVDDIYVVSGGFIGSKYDIIVDSYRDPKSIVGVCKGSGKIFFDLDEVAKKKLQTVEEYIHRSEEK